MRSKLMALGLLIALGALALSACEPTMAGVGTSPTLVPTAAPVEPSATEQPIETPAPTPISDAQDEEMVRDPEIVSLDETWNQYTNYRLGFTIRFPKEMATFRGSCTWNEAQGSFRPEMAFVPVSTFEDDDAVYIAPEHYYELAGEREDGGIHYYDACNQVTNSLELLRGPEPRKEPFWKLQVAEVRSESDLDSFLKARYGSGCSLGEQALSAQDGVFDVSILGDGKDWAVSQCPINYGTVVKYYPAGDKVIAWDTGQAYTFLAALDWSAGYDFEMVDSFAFLTGASDQAEVSAENAEPVQADHAQEEEQVTRAAEVASLDETWNQYTNYRLNFTIRFPKEMAAMLGSCTWNEEQGSYRPEMAFLPVGIFEDADAVYIAPEHFFELAGERVDGGKHYYDECNQVTNSLELLRDHDIPMLQFWKLVVKEARDEGELEDFIKARYGSGCSLGEQVASAQAGVFDVSILGDGKDLAESQCPMNYGYRVKYFPSGGRVIAWNIGQAWTFLSAVDWSAGYDFEMIESFQFLTEASVVSSTDPIEPDADWTSYINNDYGFSFDYPTDWALESIPQRPLEGAGPGDPQWLADAVLLHNGRLAISIQFSHPSIGGVALDGRLGGSGVVQDAVVARVVLTGQEAQRWTWSDSDGINAIVVQAVSEDADLALTIQLYDSGVEWIGDPGAEPLPETAIAVLEGILGSFALTQK